MNRHLIHDSRHETFTLDRFLLAEVTHHFDTDSTIKQCFDIYERFLLDSVEVRGASATFKRYASTFIRPFLRDALRSLLILGWVPYRVTKIRPKNGEEPFLIPEVLSLNYIEPELVVDTQRLTYSLKFYDAKREIQKRAIKYYAYERLQTLANPHLMYSPTMRLLNDFRYLTQIKQYTLQAESVRSCPPVYLTETDKQQPPGKNIPGMVENGRGGGDRGRTSGGSKKIEHLLEGASQRISDNIEFHRRQMVARSVEARNNYANYSATMPQYYNNLFVVPPGMTLAANPHTPESRVDQLTIERHLTSKIYQTFGIPESTIGFAGGGQSATRGSTTRTANVRTHVNIMDLTVMEATLRRYADALQELFRMVYADLFQVELPVGSVRFNAHALYETYVNSIVKEHQLDKNDTAPGSEAKSVHREGTNVGTRTDGAA